MSMLFCFPRRLCGSAVNCLFAFLVRLRRVIQRTPRLGRSKSPKVLRTHYGHYGQRPGFAGRGSAKMALSHSLGRRLTVRLQTLDLRIGVRIPASQPNHFDNLADLPMKHRHEPPIDFPVVVTIPLLWGDHDAFGHVNNLVYLRWCETARVEYLLRVGMWPPLPPAGVGPILASISCNYKRPLTFPDTVYIGASVTRIGNRSFQMQHRVLSKALDAVAAEVDSTIVMLDYGRNETVPVPEHCRKAIEDLESKVVRQDAL